VLGLLFIECKRVYINGAREHFRQYYNLMDFTILALYMASYALLFATYYRVTEASDYFNVSARIQQAVDHCSRTQMDELTSDYSNYEYGYFMAGRTLFKRNSYYTNKVSK